MELSFNVIYLIYICVIVVLMSKNIKNVVDEEKQAAKRILIAFSCLFIGDLGHVGAILIDTFSSSSEPNYAILGIGGLLEMIGLIFLFMFYTDAWRIHFKHAINVLFVFLIGVGVAGLIIFTFPQNQWTAETVPYSWLIARNIPWLIQGLALAVLLFLDAKKVGDKPIMRIGIYIFTSFFFYMTVVFFGRFEPMLGMLMIFGTIIYMLWQYTSYKRFFTRKK
jgi:hypothetical protein